MHCYRTEGNCRECEQCFLRPHLVSEPLTSRPLPGPNAEASQQQHLHVPSQWLTPVPLAWPAEQSLLPQSALPLHGTPPLLWHYQCSPQPCCRGNRVRGGLEETSTYPGTPPHKYDSQRTTCVNQFSPFTMWDREWQQATAITHCHLAGPSFLIFFQYWGWSPRPCPC